MLRALNLGDLLVAVPALRALRRALPGHGIVLATPGPLAHLVTLSGAADELLPTREPAGLRWSGPPPDVAVNLHGIGPQSHAALDALDPPMRIGLRPQGWDGQRWDGPCWDDIAARHAHERERWCDVLAHFGITADPEDLRLPLPHGVGADQPDSPVLVHPGARYGSKCWPADRFADVARALNRPQQPVLITGGADEHDLACAVAGMAGLSDSRVLAGRTDLVQLCALVAGAALVVSGDTGVAHLAYAFGTPSVTIFGPVGPAQWGPPPNGRHAVLGDAAARRGDPFADDPDPALLAVTPGEVLRAAAALGGC